ncbi:MAG TPA: protein phosphatase 2C domain-containing protein [Jatrophihabitans sp.]|nr:protein phosphatase 2C domain-containing protein [Jatrophihabitans sp.]
MLTPRYGCATDVGRLRSENQDSMYAGDGLFLVADGMGGQPAGDLASKLAIAELSTLTPPLSRAALEAAINRANDRLLAEGRQDPRRYGMGTTLSGLAAVEQDRWAVVNIGDSRVYRYAAGRVEQLTVDHSAVQALVDAGLLDQRAALRHPRRNVVTRSLGTEPAPVPDIVLRHPVPGERFLICSDGLTNELSDAEIGRLLAEADEPQQAAEQLVAQAVLAGGRDNVTVIVVQLDEAG